MAFEPAGFNVLGVSIDGQQIDRMIESFREAYVELAMRSRSWQDVRFCKRELVSLWDGTVQMVEEFSELEDLQRNPTGEEMAQYFNRDNQEFLAALGRLLRRNEALLRPLEEMQVVEIGQGSIRFSFRDKVGRGVSVLTIDARKVLTLIKKDATAIKNQLEQFVDYVKEHKQLILTGAMIAGIIVVSIVGLGWVGAAIGSSMAAKQLIFAVLSLFCVIWGVIGSKKDVGQALNALSRMGLGLQ